MAKRAKIFCWLLGAAALSVLYWWALVPKIHTASEAEVRAHVAPELLLPLPRPAGGVERYDALRAALEPLRKRRLYSYQQGVSYLPAMRLDDPEVLRVIEVLQSGPLDRAGIPYGQQAQVWTLVDGLLAVAEEEADRGRWTVVLPQIEAAWLVLDRLAQCDASIDDRISTLSLGRRLRQHSLRLAGRQDLPVAVAERLAALNARDYNDAESIRRVLAGDMQYEQLKWIPDYRSARGEEQWVPAGTYDPLETAELFSDMYLEALRNMALPVSRWSHDTEKRAGPVVALVRLHSRSGLREVLQAASMRPRMNTSANSLGRQMAALVPVNIVLMKRVLQSRTTQDQVGAALAVSRFRRGAGRDPANFEELVAAGLLQAVPRDHQADEPRAFDLQKLFEWPSGNSF